jgi:hypothetical protein
MGWKYVNLRQHCVDLIKPDSICVELGVLEGFFSKEILTSTNIKKLYLIDPWVYTGSFWSLSNKISTENLSFERGQDIVDRVYQAVVKDFENDDRVIIIRKGQEEAINDIPESIDWLYYDSLHDYQPLLETLEQYLPKMSIGGYMGGNSYSRNEKERAAVNEFLVRHRNDVEIVFLNEGYMGDYFLKRIK